MLTKRIARNPDSNERFLTFCNLHSISTCCALLRHCLRRLAVWGGKSYGCEIAPPTIPFQLPVGARPRPVSPFPRKPPSCGPAQTNNSSPPLAPRPPPHPPPRVP